MPDVDGSIPDFPGIGNMNRPKPVRHRFFKRVEKKGLAIDGHVLVEGEGTVSVDVDVSPHYMMIFGFAESCSFPDVKEMCVWVEGRKNQFSISCIENVKVTNSHKLHRHHSIWSIGRRDGCWHAALVLVLGRIVVIFT